MSVVSGILVWFSADLSAQDVTKPLKPFPQNRLKSFYFHQAEQLLDADQIPDLIPQFPGLDGGAFGHWGQNPEEVNFDHTLNDVDTGNVVRQVINHFGTATTKGVAVHVDKDSSTTVLFDPEKMSFVDTWQDGFVQWGVSRFGVIGGVQAKGRQWIGLNQSGWHLPEKTQARYEGFFRNGTTVVFQYRVGSARLLDAMTFHGGRLIRTIRSDQTLGEGVHLKLMTCRNDVVMGRQRKEAGVGTSGPLVYSSRISDDSMVVVTQAHSLNSQLVASDNDLVVEFTRSTNETPDSGTLVQLELSIEPIIDAASPGTAVELADVVELAELAKGGAGQWVSQTVTTTGVPGSAGDGYAIDTLTVPFGEKNPFRTPMRLCGIGSLSDGRIVVSTLIGDVWLVTSSGDDLKEIHWQRIAAGFYQPLGLVVHNDQIVVLGRDQVTRLHDLNGDLETDFYECLTNDYPTTPGHDFCTSLQQDQMGNLYWFTAAQNFGVTMLKDAFHDPVSTKPASIATGLRNSNGIGVSSDGSVVYATVQEGTWTPASAIFEVRNGSYHGFNGPRDGTGKYGYDLPLCFLPRGVDNSSGELAFLPQDRRLGPLSGATIGTSFGDCSYYVVLREVVNGKYQGGIVPMPGEFESGACRLSFNQYDGCIYVAGTSGWQSYAQKNGCLQRIRYTGRPVVLPTSVEARNNGLLVRFSDKIDADSVQLSNVFCQQWNYLYSAAYGSPEYSVKDPGRQAHDFVRVKSVHVLSDQQSVFLEIPELHPVMQFHLHMRLRNSDGQMFTPDAYTSIFELGPAFTEFEGYELIAKRRDPDFPVAEKFALDPRLSAQDQYGTNFGWVQSATKLSISAIPGLQYEPRRLRIAPRRRVALTFHNTDPSMPHNIAIVKADSADAFAEKAMMLASNPRAIATHYVPQDSAEICFSPILNPLDQYTVYFEAPEEQGEYRIICTYPGHSRVMRGTLFVLPDDQPMPEETDAPVRRFVRNWQLQELSDAAETMTSRSYENGKAVFVQAGCIKCHRIGSDDSGLSGSITSALGPDLSKVRERFRGAKLLQQVLEPSAEISKQHQTWIVVTNEGRTLTGLMTDSSDTSVTLVTNPLIPDHKTIVARSDIDEILASDRSTMPEGLLMVFDRDEILDLLAYIQSGANDQDEVFRK
ncbi:MAG: c-type cytochrome [Planctomycetaceae bacterium]|nr:c-type cytochrome [Planctomycetaceae bacterium]